MECPDCKSKSVIIKDGQKRCEAQGCLYLEFNVITYENENRQFQGQKGAENRFTSISYNAQGGQKQVPKYEKNFDRAGTVIKQLIRAMQLSDNLKDSAQLKLKQILKVKYPEEKEKLQLQHKQRKQAKDEKDQKDGLNSGNSSGNTSVTSRKYEKLNVSDKHIGAYCLWLACYDKNMQFKDVRIANQLGITKIQWAEIHTKMQSRFKTILNIPQVNPQQYIRRICQKRKINKIQQNAMLQMAKNIRAAQKIGGKKNATIAACIFWQIMLRSSKYNSDDKFDIKNYLQKTSKNPDQNRQKYWTQKQFDISFDAIKKFKNEQLEPNIQSYIPQFATRRPYYDDKYKNMEDKLGRI